MAKEPENKSADEQETALDVEDLIAKAKAEAVEEAKAEWEKEQKAKAKPDKKAVQAAEKSAPAPEPDDYLEQRVPVFLPKLPEKDKPKFVALNGETIRIPRGKRVWVKRKYVIQMKLNEQQDGRTLDMISRMTEKDQNYGDVTK